MKFVFVLCPLVCMCCCSCGFVLNRITIPFMVLSIKIKIRNFNIIGRLAHSTWQRTVRSSVTSVHICNTHAHTLAKAKIDLKSFMSQNDNANCCSKCQMFATTFLFCLVTVCLFVYSLFCSRHRWNLFSLRNFYFGGIKWNVIHVTVALQSYHSIPFGFRRVISAVCIV